MNNLPLPEPDSTPAPKKRARIEPLPRRSFDKGDEDNNPAANVIRTKLDRIYAGEPDAEQEAKEADAAKKPSKHQKFMHELSTSGKSLAAIQTEWHNYYLGLPDNEKHEVWQEFYEANSKASRYETSAAPKLTDKKPTEKAELKEKPKKATSQLTGKEIEEPESKVKAVTIVNPEPLRKTRRPAAIKKQIRDKVNARVSEKTQTKVKNNIKSLIFGLSLGAAVLIIFLFSFFNQYVLTPFIQPGHAAATPIIIGTNGIDASTKPNEIIIPKLNLEIPTIYSVKTTDENQIEDALENGIVHYPTTVNPGQKGNAAFFGHSSNNIFNPGHYKFAFTLLHTLKNGDTFYIIFDHKIYTYKMISRKIVDPSDVSVLNNIPGQVATATLITCDPPGTSLHRLVVVGQQISPSPTGNSAAPATQEQATKPKSIVGNGKSWWQTIF